jgi:primosomal protein N''
MKEYLDRIDQNARELHEISKTPDIRPGLADKIRYRADAIVAQIAAIRQLPTPVEVHATTPASSDPRPKLYYDTFRRR